jgi:hypothetical protein
MCLERAAVIETDERLVECFTKSDRASVCQPMFIWNDENESIGSEWKRV